MRSPAEPLRRVAAPGAVALALLLGGCALSHEPEPCSPDAPCADELACVERRCLPPCERDAECADELRCIGGGCVACACTADADCGLGLRCLECACVIDERECADLDGDGYEAGRDCDPGALLDCDDADPSTNPAASEICGDGIDQDCADGPDGCCGCECGIPPRDCGVGLCAGTQMCKPSGWTECTPLVLPAPEACGADGLGNGLDEDCDGVVDDGCAD